MATEYSIQKMVSDGTLSTIALGIQYLQRNDIYIRIAGEETPQSGAPSGYTWSFLDNTTLKILPVVPNGVEVVVYRRTDIDAMYNIYSQNAQFDEATIDENNQQLLYIAQEYLEQGLPGAGVDTIEFLRDDGTTTYYRIKRTDGSYSEEFQVPSAGSITKILARESLRRSYAEADYNLVDGSFEAGGTLVNANDVLLQESTGKAFSGTAGPVAAGTDPASGGFVDKSTAPDFFDVSIKNFGAVGGGADDTAAIDAALAYHDFVYVPDGVFRSSNNDIEYWRLYGIGKVILPVQAVEISPSPQGRALHKSYKQTYGRFEQAAACSIVANPSDQTYTNTQINGTDARGLAQDYPGRDHVGQFIWARGFMPVVTTPTNTTYTQSSITAPEIVAHAKPNMIIETVGSNKATAIVTRVEGNTAFCSGWFTATANNVTPPNGIGATINPINKLFGQNIVISPESDPAMASAGTEYNIFTQGVNYNLGVRGVDVSFEPGGGGGDVGVMVRGKRNITFYSYDSDVGNGAEYGFRSKGDKRGLSIRGATVAPIEVEDAGGASIFGVGIDGSVRTSNITRTCVNPFQAGVGGFTFSDVVSDPNYGARFTIWGFNIVGGARFRHEVIMNGSGATVIGGLDETGLGVHYSVSNGRSLVIRTTTGVVQAMASAEYVRDGLT